MTPEGSTHVDTFTGTTSSVSRTASDKLTAAAVIRQMRFLRRLRGRMHRPTAPRLDGVRLSIRDRDATHRMTGMLDMTAFCEGYSVFEAEDLRDWRGADVVDAHGSKIGTLEGVYFDTATQEPTFATVQVGIVGRRRLEFVPLSGATVAPTHVRVQADKQLVKDAPSIEMDGELAAADEPAIYEHYKLAYRPGASGERRLGRR